MENGDRHVELEWVVHKALSLGGKTKSDSQQALNGDAPVRLRVMTSLKTPKMSPSSPAKSLSTMLTRKYVSYTSLITAWDRDPASYAVAHCVSHSSNASSCGGVEKGRE